MNRTTRGWIAVVGVAFVLGGIVSSVRPPRWPLPQPEPEDVVVIPQWREPLKEPIEDPIEKPLEDLPDITPRDIARGSEEIIATAVPGPGEPVGIPGPEGPPLDIAPPPGLGAGTGGLLEGTGALAGMGGPLASPWPRGPAERARLVRDNGGNSGSESCVARGLAWLAKQQKPNGSWVTDGTARDDIAGTGLALLPFLAAGQTHKADPGVKKEYAQAVERGLKYLISKQRNNGSFHHNSYSQAIATIALCEAYGMTRDPNLRNPAQRALKYIEECQHSLGGWRYQPKQPGDTSVTGWQLQALKSGKMAKLSVDDGKMKLVGSFLDSVSEDKGATYGYVEKTRRPSTTAVGLLCRLYLAWGPNNPHLLEGLEYLKKSPPSEVKPDFYYLYYATQVFFLALSDDWSKFWNPKVRDLLIKRQVKAGDMQLAGSWDPDDTHTGTAGGRLVCTCLSLLTLEVYYRHLPLYKRNGGGIEALEKP
jgi:hypothetical protein